MSQERQFAWAPEDTPAWLRTHPSEVARGEKNFVEIDVAVGDEIPEELVGAKGWGQVPQSMWDNLLGKVQTPSGSFTVYLFATGDDVERPGSLAAWEREALGYIHIFHNGSPVWWVDLNNGPKHVATLRDLLIVPQPKWWSPWYEEAKREPDQPLYLMSIDQWDNAAWPPESQGGPPFREHVSVAREASMPSTFLEDRVGKLAYSPEHTPEWLTVWPGPPGQGSKMFVEIDATGVDDELWKAWDPRPRDPQTIAFAYLQQLLLARDASWRYDASTDLSSIHSVDDRNILESIDIRHLGSPVWWVDLDDGPVQVASLFDLVNPREPVRFHGVDAYRAGKLWLMSLDQWDNVEWPAESQGGPPYTPHVSVARENPMHAAEPPTLEPMAATKSEAAWRLTQDLLALGWTEEPDVRSKYVGPHRRRRGRRRRRRR